MEVRNNLSINERFQFWERRESEAQSAENIELALMFETLREYVRNQRSICNRLERTGQEQIRDNFPDVVFFEEDHTAFGMDLNLQIDPEKEGQKVEQGVHIGFIRFDKKTVENTPVPNVHPSELVIDGKIIMHNGVAVYDQSSIEPKIRQSIVSILRGYDPLAFVYTPFVMAVTRATSLSLYDVWIDADPGALTWKMKAVAGSHVISAEMNFGAVKEYFNL